MSVNFVAIDFETANSFRGSACSVGLTRVANGTVKEKQYWLMRPPEGFDAFDPRNVAIHQLTPDMVKNAPRFGELLDPMMNFIGQDPVVAHNANFDVGVIRSAAEVSQLNVPAFRYGCSLQLARKNYDLPSYGLAHAALAAGWSLTDHHNAQADADACAAIVTDVCHKLQAHNFEAALQASDLGLRLSPDYISGSSGLTKATQEALAADGVYDATRNINLKNMPVQNWQLWPDEGSNPDPNPHADPDHPLYGHHVVFTGGLSVTRQQAKNLAAECGAQTGNRVINRTTILVIGDGFRPEDLLRQETTISTGTKKAQNVLERRAQGQQIEIFSEAQFFQALHGNWPDGVTPSSPTTESASY